jgi:uncharacterized protein YuzE
MKIEYDPEANALYITLRDGQIDHTVEVSENLYIDIGPDGEPLGIEILAARELIGPESLGNITLINLLTEPVGAA